MTNSMATYVYVLVLVIFFFCFLQHLEVHETVAECMIFANHWVAKKISNAFPSKALVSDCHVFSVLLVLHAYLHLMALTIVWLSFLFWRGTH